MKKSMTLLILGVGFAAGAALTQFPLLRASAQPNVPVPDEGIASLQVLQGQEVSVAAESNAGIWQGKVVSVNAGWITLDSTRGSDTNNGKPITRIPITRVLCIMSAK